MKRYYYTDPVAVAWMQKKFEMKFVDDCGKLPVRADIGHSHSELIVFKDNIEYSYKSWQRVNKAYLYHESECLLELQMGDYVEIDRNYWDRKRGEHDLLEQLIPARVIGGIHFMEISVPGMGFDSWSSSNGEKPTIPYRIIQRNGKAFFWPECEEV